MNQPASIVAIRAVQAAALNLTLVCTEIVGPVKMAVSMPSVKNLGDRVPPNLLHDIDPLDEESKK